MAQRRMFNKSITNSSKFIMMPPTSRLLYYDLGMNADDDGFCEHFTIMKMTDATPDDLRVLQARGLVKVFDDRVLIIRDWKENNYLQKDRYTPSKYLEQYKKELKLLAENNSGRQNVIPNGNQMDTKCLQNVNTGKVRIDKDSNSLSPSEIMNLFLEREDYFNKVTEAISEKYEIPKNVVSQELGKFKSYWSELNSTGTKQRWQLQKTFELKRRIATWLSGNNKFSQSKGKKIII